ncbi:MAG: endonuclease domain-containing protein, partial [Sporichthyaceae bacterium]
MEITQALRRCGGAARWSRLCELGVRERDLRAAVIAGRVSKTGRGGYFLPDAPPCLVTALMLGGVASHASAAALHGLALWTPPEVFAVTVALGTRKAAYGVRVHRADLSEGDLDPRLLMTSLQRTLLDCGRTMPLMEAVVVLDSALHGHMIGRAALRRAAEAARGHGATALRQAVSFADALSESALESVLRLLLELTGAELRSQVHVEGVGVVDFLLDGWLVIEADGFAFHSDRPAYRNDRRRANALAERGYVLLRFTWEDLKDKPMWVLAQVEAVRVQAGRRRPASKGVTGGARPGGGGAPRGATGSASPRPAAGV